MSVESIEPTKTMESIGETKRAFLLTRFNARFNVRFNKRLALLAIFYTAQGIPIYFFTLGLPTILRQEGVHLEVIGLLGFLGIPWAIKFLWAPLIDLGKRKTWILPLQILLAILFWVLSYYPVQNGHTIAPILILGLLAALMSATQDIAIDGLAVEMLNEEERGSGSAMQAAGTGLGAILGGTLSLYLYEQLGWQQSLKILSLLNFLPLCILIPFAIPDSTNQVPQGSQVSQVQRQRPSLKNFFHRPMAIWLLCYCLVYRLSEGLFMGMQSPFLIDLKVTPTQIGFYLGVMGGIIGPVVALTTAPILKKTDPLKFLFTLSVLKVFCYFVMTALVGLGFFNLKGGPTLAIVIILFHLALRYLIMVGLYTLFMSFCSLKQAGTDITIMGCFELLFYMIAVAFSGLSASTFGHVGHYGITTFFALVSLLSYPFFKRKLRQCSLSIRP